MKHGGACEAAQEIGGAAGEYSVLDDMDSMHEGWQLSANRFILEPGASAFTVAKPGEMLPIEHKHSRLLGIRKGTFYEDGLQWQVMYVNQFGDVDSVFHNNTTGADARARMLIYVLEKKLI